MRPYGDNGKEFGYMVAAGMKPMDAIVSATSAAAKVLGEKESPGQLEVGFTADIVAVKGNPLEDITLLESVDIVMKAGSTIKE